MKRNPKRQLSTEKPQPEEKGKEAFSLYVLLEVDRKASTEEIKAAYKRIALKTHPDKNKEDPQAKEKFAQLHEAYQILTDKEKRAEYDETGRVGSDFNLNSFEECYRFFRNLYKPITKQDITDFAGRYVGGDMQREDLTKYYLDHHGDLTQLLENIPLCQNKDLERFIAYYEEQIEKGELKKTKAYVRTKDAIKLLDEPKPRKKKEVSKQKPEKKVTTELNTQSEPTQPRKIKPADIGRSVPKRPVKKPANKPAK